VCRAYLCFGSSVCLTFEETALSFVKWASCHISMVSAWCSL